jgi:hypothetical protein
MIQLLIFMALFIFGLLILTMCYPHIGIVIHDAIAHYWHKYIMRK